MEFCRKYFLPLMIAMIITVGAPARSFADTSGLADCIERGIERTYHFGGNSKNPLTFSYEIETDPRESPRILNYYKLPDYSDEEWNSIPLQARIGLVLETHTTKKLKEKILVKMNGAPSFLSDDLEAEAGSRVEASRNEITSSLDTINEHLEWFWENIGPGSVQGHVVFQAKGLKGLSEPVRNFIKNDFDLGQTEALSKGYTAYLERGSIP
jgi:hypothetical protein